MRAARGVYVFGFRFQAWGLGNLALASLLPDYQVWLGP